MNPANPVFVSAAREMLDPSGLNLIKALNGLRLLSEANHQLYELQAEQLRRWPQVLLPHCLKSETRVQPDLSRVDVILKKTRGKPARDVRVRYQQLADSIRWLLGSRVRVRIYSKNRTLLHESVHERPEPKAERRQQPG